MGLESSLVALVVVVGLTMKEEKIVEFAACNAAQPDYDMRQLRPMLDEHELPAFVRNSPLTDPSSFMNLLFLKLQIFYLQPEKLISSNHICY